MAISGVSSSGYNTVYATNANQDNRPVAKPIAEPKHPNLTGCSTKDTALSKTAIKYDTYEQGEKPFTAPKKLVHTPIARNIAWDTMTSFNEHLRQSLDKAASMNLSYGASMAFLKQEGMNWVEDIRQNEPEMFVQWLKDNKKDIENGRQDLASLPSSFTMSDYYSYVKEE